MLPFEDQESANKKKWTCFACGTQHLDFETFADHMKNSHEEGRDFIICPFQICGAPVRDLALHARVFHAGKPLPPGVQLRATVWRDFSGKKPKVTTKFRQGTFISNKNNGKEFFYRSGFEAEVFELLEQLPDVVSYDVEKLRIGYLAPGGKPRTYVPDLTLLFADGRKAVWEIKPANQTSLPINEAKWTAAQDFCVQRGWSFMVLTEKGRDSLKAQVRNLRG